MARVTAAETSSREGKRCPCMGFFNLWNKSKSGGLMSGLYGAWGNTSHSYLLSKSVKTFPRWGCALSCRMSGPSPSIWVTDFELELKLSQTSGEVQPPCDPEISMSAIKGQANDDLCLWSPRNHHDRVPCETSVTAAYYHNWMQKLNKIMRKNLLPWWS